MEFLLSLAIAAHTISAEQPSNRQLVAWYNSWTEFNLAHERWLKLQQEFAPERDWFYWQLLIDRNTELRSRWLAADPETTEEFPLPVDFHFWEVWNSR